MRTAVAAIFSALKRQHVLTQTELESIAFKELHKTELSEEFSTILQKFTIQVNGKYYLRQLDTTQETSIRNVVLELATQGKMPKSGKVPAKKVQPLIDKALLNLKDLKIDANADDV